MMMRYILSQHESDHKYPSQASGSVTWTRISVAAPDILSNMFDTSPMLVLVSLESPARRTTSPDKVWASRCITTEPQLTREELDSSRYRG
jgi:hypothetical protein